MGVLSLSLISRFYGVSEQRDFWIFSISIISAIELFFFGPINETFRSKFIEVKSKSGEEKALEIVSILIFFIFLIVFTILVVVYLNPSVLSFFISKSLNIKSPNAYFLYFIILLPIILLNQLISLLISVLNVYDKVLTPEIIYLLSSLVNILIIYFLSSMLGLYALVISLYSSSFFILSYLLYKVFSLGIRFPFSISLSSTNQLFTFLKFSFPLYIPYAIGQISSILEKFLIGTVGVGSLSIIDYSRKICDTVNTLNSGIILTLFVPILSKLNIAESLNEFKYFFNKQFERGLLLVVLIVSLLISSSSNIVELLYNYGKLSIESINKINSLTLLYVLAIFPVFIYSYSGYSLIATGKTKAYSYYTSLNQILIIFFIFVGSKRIGIYIFPIVMGVIHLFSGILMLKKTSPNFKINLITVAKFIFLIAVNFLIGLLIKTQIIEFSNLSQLFFLIIGCLFGLLIQVVFLKKIPILRLKQGIISIIKNV